MKAHPQRSLLRKIAVRRLHTTDTDAMALRSMTFSGEVTEAKPAWRRRGLLEPRILTPREQEVLRFVARGETDQRIADQLYLSRRTVSSHVSNILTKLDVPSRRAAVIAALRIGLL